MLTIKDAVDDMEVALELLIDEHALLLEALKREHKILAQFADGANDCEKVDCPVCQLIRRCEGGS